MSGSQVQNDFWNPDDLCFDSPHGSLGIIMTQSGPGEASGPRCQRDWKQPCNYSRGDGTRRSPNRISLICCEGKLRTRGSEWSA